MPVLANVRIIVPRGNTSTAICVQTAPKEKIAGVKKPMLHQCPYPTAADLAVVRKISISHRLREIKRIIRLAKAFLVPKVKIAVASIVTDPIMSPMAKAVVKS